MRSHYWTIGKFADWLRGTPKLKCGTSEQWDAWEKQWEELILLQQKQIELLMKLLDEKQGSGK